MTMIMTNRVEAIQAWMQQIQTAIEEKNRDELDPIELHILHWICFNGFEDMHDVQIGVIFMSNSAHGIVLYLIKKLYHCSKKTKECCVIFEQISSMLSRKISKNLDYWIITFVSI